MYIEGIMNNPVQAPPRETTKTWEELEEERHPAAISGEGLESLRLFRWFWV
jgi:hypothetical protein